MQEHHFAVPRTARYYSLGRISADVTDVWFVCHGYGQLASEFLEPFRAVEDARRLVIAPEGLSRHYTNHAERKVGASWMTREDREFEIADYVRYLDLVAGRVLEGIGADGVRRRALGFSQGAATVWRWAATGETRLDQLVLWAGGVPPDLPLDAHRERLVALDVVLVVGEDDEYAGPEAVARERARLAQHEIPHRLITFPGGHRLSRDVLRSLAAASGVSA